MIGLGLATALIALVVLWTLRQDRVPAAVASGPGSAWSRLLLWAAVAMPFLPLAAMSVGWIFTEMRRQLRLTDGRLFSQSLSLSSLGDYGANWD